jgi:hypothetical protein
MKLLATTDEDNGWLKEDSHAISAPQSCTNNSSQSPYMTPAHSHSPYMISAPAALAATAPQELVAAIDSQSTALAATALVKSALSKPRRPLQVAMADSKQE